MNPTIQIDHLSLRLPPEWQGQARLFTHYLSQRLSALDIRENRQIDHLDLPPIQARAGDSYQVVARRVARQIGAQLNTPSPFNPSPVNRTGHDA